MSVGEHTRRNLATVDPSASIREAARLMEIQKAGCVVVVSGSGQPLGVMTDRDIAMRVLRIGLDPDETTVGSVIDRELKTVTESTPLTKAMRRMRTEGVRRLPVVDADGKLVGIFDWIDAVGIVSSEIQHAARIAGAQSSEA